MGILAAFMVPHPPLIVPAIGRGGEKVITETTRAYEKVADEIAALKPETIIITSPHSIMYSDYIHISPGMRATGNFAQFGAPSVSFTEEYDYVLRDKICEIVDEVGFPAGVDGERDPRLDHGTMVPLWFIRQKYSGGKIIRIGLSGLSLSDHYRFGEMIQKAVNATGRKVVFVASGDLSHKLKEDGPYGFVPEGPQYDERIMDVARRAAFDELITFSESFCERAAECGHRSFTIMAGALEGMRVKPTVYSHQDVTGVGYGIASFYPMQGEEKSMSKENFDPYVRLAWDSLESYIAHGSVLDLPEDLPREMYTTAAGAFVSIHEHGMLRGCIGTIFPTTECVAEEIIQNAISASTKDPRFRPITEDEIPFLEINVDVMGTPEPIDSPSQLDVKRYGVIVTKGGRRGLLLPDLDGVDTVEDQIAIAKQKAGISPFEEVELQRFEVIRHEEK
jgi:AmmeMemoRadiSam system protein A